MIKAFVTDAVVSKGYNGQDALKYSEDGKSVRFRIGKKVYDTRCENNTRWFNIGVKAFGAVCERIKKMQLKDGSYVSFIGKLDEDTWTDKETGETKTAMVIIVDDIEYTVSGGSNKDSNNQNRQNTNSANGPKYVRCQAVSLLLLRLRECPIIFQDMKISAQAISLTKECKHNEQAY